MSTLADRIPHMGSTTRILGVDPGSRKTGWGVIEVDAQTHKVRHIDNGVLYLEDTPDLSVRLVELATRLREVVVETRPDFAAVEDIFVAKGARSALILGQARGAALAALGLTGLRIASLSTTMVKQAVTGSGRAGKMQVGEWVRVLLGLRELMLEDAADALAVALTAATIEGHLHVDGRFSRTEMPPPTAKKSGARSKRTGLADLARAQGKL